jgi:hypothetical protein
MQKTSSKKTMVYAIFALLTLSVLSTAVLSAFNGPTSVFAQEQKFNSKLTGQGEVPPKTTEATGTAFFFYDGKSMYYEVDVTNINNVTLAHIHEGKTGVNGPVVVVLLNSESKPLGMVHGPLAQGSFTAADLKGPLSGKQLSDLVNMIKDGDAYVNVHTTQNPEGEIRGQLS